MDRALIHYEVLDVEIECRAYVRLIYDYTFHIALSLSGWLSSSSHGEPQISAHLCQLDERMIDSDIK